MWSCRSLTRGDNRVPMLHPATGIYKQNDLFVHGEVEVFCCFSFFFFFFGGGGVLLLLLFCCCFVLVTPAVQAEFSHSGNRSLSTWSSSCDTVMLDAIHLATCVSLGSMFHYPFLRDSGSNSFETFIRTQVAYQLSSKWQ